MYIGSTDKNKKNPIAITQTRIHYIIGHLKAKKVKPQ